MRLTHRESSRSASDTTIRMEGALVTPKSSAAFHDVASTAVLPPGVRHGPRLSSASTGAIPDVPRVWFSRSSPCSRPHDQSSASTACSRVRSSRASTIACRRMSSRVSTWSSVVASSHQGLAGLVEHLGHDRHPALATVRPDLLGQVVVEGQREDVAPHDVEVRRCRAVGGLGVVPRRQQLLAVGVVAAGDLLLEEVGDQERRERAAVVELQLGHLLDGELALLHEHLTDPLGAVAAVPVVGEVEGIVRIGHRLVGRDHEPLLGVEHARQALERHVVAGPVVVGPPALGREVAVVARLADRDQAGRLVPDVSLAVGVDHVLRRHRELGRGLPERRPVGGGVEGEDRVRRGGGLQPRPRQGHGVRLVATVGVVDRRLLADVGEVVGDVGQQRTVVGASGR